MTIASVLPESPPSIRLTSGTFREALARFASGVTVVTAPGPRAPAGFTATGFTSVSLEPPLVLVCVGKKASAHDVVVEAERFGVSILAEEQRWIAEQFARSGVDRFRGVPLRGASVPLIDGALAGLECARRTWLDAGDHTVLIGEVLDASIARGDGRPLVHWQRHFGSFTGASL
jgi:flavin reductase ActVB